MRTDPPKSQWEVNFGRLLCLIVGVLVVLGIGISWGGAKAHSERLDSMGVYARNKAAEDLQRIRAGAQMGLYFYETPDTDGLLRSFRRIPGIQVVTFENCDITVNGVISLRTFPDLHTINIQWGCRGIDDTALGQISRMKQLNDIRVANFTGSDEAIQKLRDALPDCQVKVTRAEFKQRN